MTVSNRKLKQWGYSAYARYCANIGIPFDDCYYMIFKRHP